MLTKISSTSSKIEIDENVRNKINELNISGLGKNNSVEDLLKIAESYI